VSLLRQREQQLALQQRLSNYVSQFATLAAQPNNQNTQQQVSNYFHEMEAAFLDFIRDLTPSQQVQISEIGADNYFSMYVVHWIAKEISENPLTPAILVEKFERFSSERNAFVQSLNSLDSAFKSFGLVQEGQPNPPGALELSVLIPRQLFENRLRSFAKELRVLDRIVRVFSEFATGEIEEPEITQLSTSDPLITLMKLSPLTLLAIAKTIDWLLAKWKEVEDIRKVRAETAKLGLEAPLQAFDKAIEDKISQAVDLRTKELLSSSKMTPSRTNELTGELKWAIESLNARLERGLRVDVRILASPVPSDEKIEELYRDIDTLGKRLTRLELIDAEHPVLQLPSADPPTLENGT
jgi:hypothetical protein